LKYSLSLKYSGFSSPVKKNSALYPMEKAKGSRTDGEIEFIMKFPSNKAP